jgi:hypothetical protein
MTISKINNLASTEIGLARKDVEITWKNKIGNLKDCRNL